jgi:hypothetical protein
MPPEVRYAIAVVGTSLVLLLHLCICVTTPLSEAWSVWIAGVIFAMLLAAMLRRSSWMLKVATWVCYVGLAASAFGISIGLIGILRYSVELAVYLPAGVVYAFMLAVCLAGIQEAKHQVRDRTSTEGA